MNCDICHRQSATIHIQEIINGARKSVHLCGDCAARKNLSTQVLRDFTVSEFLSTFSELAEKLPGAKAEETVYPDISCGSCGTSAQDFQESGTLGCPECYDAMAIVLEDMLEELHRDTTHIGKPPRAGERPSQASLNDAPMVNLQIDLLRRELQDAVTVEDYERAAHLRDEMTTLTREQAV